MSAVKETLLPQCGHKGVALTQEFEPFSRQRGCRQTAFDVIEVSDLCERHTLVYMWNCSKNNGFP